MSSENPPKTSPSGSKSPVFGHNVSLSRQHNDSYASRAKTRSVLKPDNLALEGRSRMGSKHFPPEFFRGNRERLRQLFTGTAPIIITANGLTQWSTDSAHPFKQDGSFWYLTGIDHPNILLVMDKGKEYLIVPKLSASQEAFDGAINLDEISTVSGVVDIVFEKEGWKRLEVRLKRVQNVATLSPAQPFIEALGMFTNPARRRLIDEIKTINGDIEFLDLRQHVQKMRMVKQSPEVKAITKAVDITVGGLKVLERKFQQGRYAYEYEAELDLTREYYKRGSNGHSFPPIIAAGAKASTIHPFGNIGAIKKEQPLLADVGAEYEHYAADLTRTWHTKPNKRFLAIHQAVISVFDYAISLLKPGIIMREYESKIEKYMGEKLRELNLIKTIDHQSVRTYFPHATSHHLGIDVHDIADYEEPLQAGAIITVEPGIYIPHEGIGVRVEDDILITQEGCTILSAKLPRSL